MSIRDDFFAAKSAAALWDVAVSIKRGNPLPIDADSIFASYADLEAYAADVLAYPGQVVAVVNADSTGIYYLDQNLAIQPVGVIPTGDNKSIEVTDAGVISLLGASTAANGTLPMIGEDGKLTWKTLEDIGAGDGNDNTTYEITALEKGEEGSKETYGIQIQVKENGVASGDPIVIDFDVYTKSEADAITNALSERIETLENKEDKDTTYSVAEGDKVLSLNGTVFSADISLKHENGMISLTGKDGVVIAEFSDSDFIKDSVLEDVAYNAESQEIVFTWKTIDGETKTDAVSVADFVQTYEAGNGLELVGNEFSVKVDSSSEAFLTVGENGVKVSGVQDAIDAVATAAAGTYATQTQVSELETALDARLDTLEAIDHTAYTTNTVFEEYKTTVENTYATQTTLNEVKQTADNAAAKVDTLEDKVEEITSVGGEPNVIDYIKVNGTILEVEKDSEGKSTKTVNIVVPTKFSDLTDDSGFDARITAAKAQADAGVSAASAAQAAADNNAAEIAKHETRIGTLETAKGDHETRIITLENADKAHATEYSTLKSIVDGHTTTIAGKADTTDLDAAIARVAANETSIKTINETTIPGLNTEIAKKANSADVYTKTEVGTIAEGKTLVEMIADAKSEAIYDDTAIKASIKANADALAILNSDSATTGSVANTAAAAAKSEVATVIGAAPETMDTLEEVAKWIENDESGAAAMANRIGANETAIAAINNADTGILAQAKKYTDDTIAGLPAATAEALGLVKYDDVTIKMNESQQLYVAKVSTDILEQGANELIINGGSAI